MLPLRLSQSSLLVTLSLTAGASLLAAACASGDAATGGVPIENTGATGGSSGSSSGGSSSGGDSGSAGHSGTSGKSGSAGHSGTAGTAGSAGSAGSTAGASGSGGSQGGTAGNAGSGGSAGSGGCAPNSKICNGQCVEKTPENGCGNTSCSPCTFPHAEAGCMGDACVIATCDPGFTDCNDMLGDGCEAVTDADPNNCGMCNTVCNAGEQCEGGVCGTFCDPGLGNCDGDSTNGCETTLGSTDNCAFCGDSCDLANANVACDAGNCTFTSCNTGFGNCDSNPSNGCETDTNTSTQHCGECFKLCDIPHATEVCNAGMCTLDMCEAGWGNCDNDLVNGCETNTNTDIMNCGGCGQNCDLANASEQCIGGVCTLLTCSGTFADCDNDPTNGCETDLSNDMDNCGMCNTPCDVPHAGEVCSNGMCVMTQCDPGWANCNNMISDGCEVNTDTSLGNCGACNQNCNLANAGESCVSGTCTLGACDPGYANCNGVTADGCEVNTDSSLSNCGGCNQGCDLANASEICLGGTCTLGMCTAPFANCNNNPVDGCEINTNTNVNNCGTCGTVCNTQCGGAGTNVTGTTCQTGACKVTSCAGLYFDVNGLCGDGCECLSSGTSAACGSPSIVPTLNLGGTQAVTGNLVPTGQEAWYRFTFTGNTSASYHPKIVFSSNPGNQFVFDVRSDCNGATLACVVEGSVSNGLTSWEVDDTSTLSPEYNVTPPVGNAGVILVRVYRKAGFNTTCNNYTLTATN